MNKKKPNKIPNRCWDCLNCDVTQTAFTREPGPFECWVCGGPMTLRPLPEKVEKSNYLEDVLKLLEEYLNEFPEYDQGDFRVYQAYQLLLDNK